MTLAAAKLTPDERLQGYVRPFRRAYVHTDPACTALTVMKRQNAAGFATCPDFYGTLYCSGCQTYLPVDEFIWDGTREVVGS